MNSLTILDIIVSHVSKIYMNFMGCVLTFIIMSAFNPLTLLGYYVIIMSIAAVTVFAALTVMCGFLCLSLLRFSLSPL